MRSQVVRTFNAESSWKYHRRVFDGTDLKEEDGMWQQSEGGRKCSWEHFVQRDRRWFVRTEQGQHTWFNMQSNHRNKFIAYLSELWAYAGLVEQRPKSSNVHNSSRDKNSSRVLGDK
jgi:hypothetical protein